ncbi:poly(A) polymerase-like protein [Tanacetum coccineum]
MHKSDASAAAAAAQLGQWFPLQDSACIVGQPKAGMGEVTELQPIPDAHVAVMKFKFQEISIDVICAFSGIPAASSLRKP